MEESEMDKIPISKTIRITEAGYNEEWLQNQIWENPACLGYGDLEGITKEAAISSGGRLDLLFKNNDDDTMYEVEVMLGETDPSHIIRTIEYWDLIRKKWPQRQHFGVLIAEKITKRYFNVIQILSNNVPLIAIQANIIDIEGKRSLHFTKILDVYEEPEDEIGLVNEIIDESFWKNKSESVLSSAKRIFEYTKDIYEDSNLVLNKTNITINFHGYNQMYFKKRYGKSVLVIFRYGSKRDEIEKILQENEMNYTDDHKRFRIQILESNITENEDMFKRIASLNNQWWRS